MSIGLHEAFNTRQAPFYAASFNAACDNEDMGKTVAERLREIRQKAGYATGSDAARAFGWTVGTYLSHENGNRGVDPETADRYARAFGVDPSQILWETGEGKPPKPARPAASGPAPLDENLLAELIRSALVLYANVSPDEAIELARSYIARARAPRGDREAARAPDHTRETPASPGRSPGTKTPR